MKKRERKGRMEMRRNSRWDGRDAEQCCRFSMAVIIQTLSI